MCENVLKFIFFTHSTIISNLFFRTREKHRKKEKTFHQTSPKSFTLFSIFHSRKKSISTKSSRKKMKTHKNNWEKIPTRVSRMFRYFSRIKFLILRLFLSLCIIVSHHTIYPNRYTFIILGDLQKLLNFFLHSRFELKFSSSFDLFFFAGIICLADTLGRYVCFVVIVYIYNLVVCGRGGN